MAEQELQNGDMPSSSTASEFSYYYMGKKMPAHAPVSTLEGIKHSFKVRNDDVYVVSYLRSGMTMMQEIVSCINAEGDMDKVNKPLLVRVPLLDTGPGAGIETPLYQKVAELPSPRLIRTHLPHEWMPTEYDEKMPKTVVLARNPKDLAVSCWYFTNGHRYLDTIPEWNDYFNMFYEGDVLYGSWFDHVLGWFSRRHEDNILFLKYEDVCRAPVHYISEIAEFLNTDLSPEVISRIAKHVHFSKMKRNPMTNYSYTKNFKTADDFFRKGKVGTWRNYFTVAQNAAFNELYDLKLKGTGLAFSFT
ncbi:sulfotransferase 1B1-like [Saccoglossus kowalevskii]|uniref:Sulfotransferase family cytosolic 1B member 1-like n=1 Tax=Saccoglossus kowalevskii TaxID=10224 RepID=A0ABM0GRJ3_SACKO|nr:PREDICTED: sulfotransferase family cytosolic 1B member 1-like [Saccoglossus kowalevskii]